MSETKERPDEAGWYFLPRDDTPRYFDGKAFVYPNGARVTGSFEWQGPLVPASQLAELQRQLGTLFDALAHGDDEHRDWLRKAIDDHFAGRAVDAVAGSGSKEVIADLQRQLGEERKQKSDLEGELACCADILNTWARETGASECHNYTAPLALRKHIDNLWGAVSGQHHKRLADAEGRVEALQSDADNAIRQIKETVTDYPWDAKPPSPMSEAAWAACCTIRGVSQANEELHAEIKRLDPPVLRWVKDEFEFAYFDVPKTVEIHRVTTTTDKE